MQGTPSTIAIPPNFPVAWEHPDDAHLLWVHDRVHFPEPVSPMEFSLFGPALEAGFRAAAQAYEAPVVARVRRINTYYYQMTALAPLPAQARAAQIQRSMERLSAVMARLGEIWATQFLPEIKRHLAAWASFDLRAASMPALLAHWDDTVAKAMRLWEIHLRILSPAMIAMSQFVDVYHHLDGSLNVYDAYRLLQGFDNKTTEAGRALWHLSRQALTLPAVRRILEETASEAVPAALKRSPAGRAFLTELGAYLEQYGQYSDKWDISYPSWIEDPIPVIKSLKDYISRPGRDPLAELAGLAAEREELLAQAREHLKRYPQPVRDRFEFLLKAAQEGTVILEDHGFYIDFCGRYQVRRVLLELGRRFVEAGALDRPGDVFYLTAGEVREITRACLEHGEGASAQLERRQLVVARQTEMEHFRTIPAPPALGTWPPGPPPDDPFTRTIVKFWGASPPPPTEPNILRGQPASRGTARGPARLIRSLAEAARLRPGDILVAATTGPSWTPLFATVAAVVTDTGGALSHGAIIAREYRIPAVVGTGMATTMIRDGQMLEVDGGAGIVYLAL